MTENKITSYSRLSIQLNRINSSSSTSPTHTNHGSHWKLGLIRTDWERKVSRLDIIFYLEMGPVELVRLGIFVALTFWLFDLFGCKWFLCKTWRFTPCPKNIICKFLSHVLISSIPSPRKLHCSKKGKTVTFTSNSLGILFYFAFFNISF